MIQRRCARRPLRLGYGEAVWRFEQGQWRLEAINGFHPLAPAQPPNRAVADKAAAKPSEKAAKKQDKKDEGRQHKGAREIPRK